MNCDKCNEPYRIFQTVKKWSYSCGCANPEKNVIVVIGEVLKYNIEDLDKRKHALESIYNKSNRARRSGKLRKAMKIEKKQFPLIERNIRILRQIKQQAISHQIEDADDSK